MRREPRVAISIHDAANPYRTLEILGTASMEQRSSYDELDAISNQYLGTDYPYKGDDPSGWLVTVEVERSSTFSDIEIPEMVEPPPKGSDLLSPPHFAHIATVSSTGQPRSSVVWHRRVDGGGENDIEFWTFPTTLKVLHLRRNPAIAVSIHDEADPYRYTEVRGTATLTPDTGPQMLDELTPLYWQADRYPESEQYPIDNDTEGVIVRVAATHRVRLARQGYAPTSVNTPSGGWKPRRRSNRCNTSRPNTLGATQLPCQPGTAGIGSATPIAAVITI